MVPRYGSGAGAGSIHFRRIKRLRASTYGRGIWEFWSDFQAAFSNNPLTVFVGQTAVFAGTLTGSNGYTSSVDLSCTAPTALVCIVSPNKTTPTTSGVSITVTVTGPAGDYALNVAGTDPSGVAHNFPLTLHVVNFNLTPPAPSSMCKDEVIEVDLTISFEKSSPATANERKERVPKMKGKFKVFMTLR